MDTFRGRGSAYFEQSGGDVNVEGELWEDGSSFYQGRVAHKQRDARGFLIRKAAFDAQAMLAVEIAFVAGEEDERLVELVRVLESFEDAPRGFVHGGQHAETVADGFV